MLCPFPVEYAPMKANARYAAACCLNGKIINRRALSAACLVLALSGVLSTAAAQELPKPSYANALIVAIEDGTVDPAEIAYIKANFNFGLYAWLSISFNHLTPVLGWHSDWTNASGNITGKATIASLVAAAKAQNVNLHLVLCSGLARSLEAYREAKEEDVRNAQWYNDNKIASDTQITQPDLMTKYAFGTLSRYARKLRVNHEAKARALAAYLKQTMDANPDLLITASGWGEAEMNYNRINDNGTLYLGDYSPFAVMEFRDWIQHTGLYDDVMGPYRGQGHAGGVTADGLPRFLGSSGLALFNSLFGTAFSDWRLRYFHWDLSDDYDQNSQDGLNPDPHKIPWGAYVHGGMIPSTGQDFIAGGFDPPRTKLIGDPYWELWRDFRETMVRNFVREFAAWSFEAGIGPEKIYSHQIPADYLFGNNPATAVGVNRYITSASSLGTADNLPFGSMGATVFDIKFGENWFVRTTDYFIPDVSALSPNWGILEYDPETYPTGFVVAQSPPDFLTTQFLRPYQYNAHLLDFFRWRQDPEHNIKGTNKEIALRDFVQLVRDKARNPDLNTMYSPPRVIGLSAAVGAPGGSPSGSGVIVQILATGKIWSGENWNWKDWGDFNLFRVYRSYDPNFVADGTSYIGPTTGYSYTDTNAPPGSSLYYRWVAVNQGGIAGPASDPVLVQTPGTPLPAISLNTAGLAFDGETGKPLSTVLQIQITNTGSPGSILHWQASADRTWIQVDPASGTGDGFLSVQVNTTGLPIGTYSGQITIDDPVSQNDPQTVAVTLHLYDQIIASLTLDKQSLTFNTVAGQVAAAQNVLIENIGTPGTVLHWQASSGQPWIQLDPISGTGNGTLSVQPAALAVGDYTGQIKVEDPAALNSPQYLSVIVHAVAAQAALSLERTHFSFGGEAGRASSTVQKTLVKNAGPAGTVLHWQASTADSWIQVSPAGGTGEGILEIKTDPSALTAGSYSGQVQVSDSAAQNSPQTIAVSLKVFSQGEDLAPFGYFDSPLDNSTVAANIPVTGWALDDIEVTRVEIRRDPHLLDPPAAIGPDGLIYVGDAVFIKGARPDVEAAEPGYPNSHRAGWGYMMLTNFLPNQGNGTFVLHAFAYDTTGHKTELGQKTIAVDNAHSVLPFGTIETPSQGGLASGNAYINWGWALTPLPNIIPADGSTIWVWVDGAPLGHPVYNNYRADIAANFPGTNNSNGAVGYFYLDTTKYAIGTHAISWGLRDGAGNESGIGSRYFDIFNSGGGAAAVRAEPGLLTEDGGGALKIELRGPRTIDVQELERVVVDLRAKGTTRFIGWGESLDRELPVGSSIDQKTGVFSWIPGPGFLGRHVLHFAAAEGTTRSRAVEVVVNIHPKRHGIGKDKPIPK